MYFGRCYFYHCDNYTICKFGYATLLLTHSRTGKLGGRDAYNFYFAVYKWGDNRK